MKTTKFLKDGNTVQVLSLQVSDFTDTLRPAVYSARFHPNRGFYLTYEKERFTVPEKVYGSALARANKVVTTYNSRTSSTGVMLTGDKGAGKTLTSSIIANTVIDQGLPVITVNEPFSGSGFNEFVNNIGECAMFFDEFAKTFNATEDDDPQNNLLTLFDGTGSQKRLIILTENNEFKVNEFMRNRPGRVHYHFRYGKLEESAILDYCKDQGVPDSVAEEIAELAFRMFEFSFDVLQAIIEEYKRYGGSVTELISDLNVDTPYNPLGGTSNKLRINQLLKKGSDTPVEVRTGFDVIDMPVGTKSSKVRFVVNPGTSDSYTDYAVVDLGDIVVREGNTVVFYDEDENLLVKAEMFSESNNINLEQLLV
jgi:ATPases of the AAA+ class